MRLPSDRPETEHTRRHAPAHVHTAGRCTSVGLRTEGVCVVSKSVNRLLPGSGNQLRCETMSGRMKKQAMCLQVLNKTKNANCGRQYSNTPTPSFETYCGQLLKNLLWRTVVFAVSVNTIQLNVVLRELNKCVLLCCI